MTARSSTAAANASRAAATSGIARATSSASASGPSGATNGSCAGAEPRTSVADAAKARRLCRGLKRGKRGQLGHAIAQVQIRAVRKQRIRRLQTAVHAAVVVVPQPHELVRSRNRQPLKHHRLDERENRDVGAQAERQSEDGYGREAGTLSEAACGNAKIGTEVIDGHQFL